MCEQLSQSRYLAVEGLEIELTAYWVASQSFNHYTINDDDVTTEVVNGTAPWGLGVEVP